MIRSFVYFNIISLLGWTTVSNGQQVEFDETLYTLQLIITSSIGSGDNYAMTFMSQNNWSAGTFRLRFSNPVRYYISKCLSELFTETEEWPILENIPVEDDKVWTIKQDATRLKVYCNGVEMVNYRFSVHSDKDSCTEYWTREAKKVLIEFIGPERVAYRFGSSKQIKIYFCKNNTYRLEYT